MAKFYAVISTKKQTSERVSTKDSKGRWSSSVKTGSKNIDAVLVSDYTDRISAISDLKYQAIKSGVSIKYIGAFK